MRKSKYTMLMLLMAASLSACGQSKPAETTAAATTVAATTEAATEDSAEADQAAADHVAALIDAIYVQERTEDTDAQCAEAKEAWDQLTDAQKALVEGEEADPDYFGRDTGDASKDDPLNEDGIGASRRELRYLLQRQPCAGYRRHREDAAGGVSGLVGSSCLHCADHHQSRPGA